MMQLEAAAGRPIAAPVARRSGPLRGVAFQRRLGELSAASDRVWLLALSVGLGFTLIAAYAVPFSSAGNFWAWAGLLIRGSLYLWAGDALRGRGGETLRRLFALGIVAGLFELLVDWGLVHWVHNGRLVYLTGKDVVLLASPVWMPLAWACVIVELGYPALRLYALLRRPLVATLCAAVAAGVTIGFYEYFAYRAQWWLYQPANAMLGAHCTLFIPFGELLMFLPILPIAAGAIGDEERPVARAIVGGARFAAAIAVGYALAYLLLEVGRPV
jgi:hypothetical protein